MSKQEVIFCQYSKEIRCKKIPEDHRECFVCLLNLMLREFQIFYKAVLRSYFPLEDAGKIVGTLRGHAALMSAVKSALQKEKPEAFKEVIQAAEKSRHEVEKVTKPQDKVTYIS